MNVEYGVEAAKALGRGIAWAGFWIAIGLAALGGH